MIRHLWFKVNKGRSGWWVSKHAEFPQRGNSAPIRASLSSPAERSHARSALLRVSLPTSLRLGLSIYSEKGEKLEIILGWWVSKHAEFPQRGNYAELVPAQAGNQASLGVRLRYLVRSWIKCFVLRTLFTMKPDPSSLYPPLCGSDGQGLALNTPIHASFLAQLIAFLRQINNHYDKDLGNDRREREKQAIVEVDGSCGCSYAS